MSAAASIAGSSDSAHLAFYQRVSVATVSAAPISCRQRTCTATASSSKERGRTACAFYQRMSVAASTAGSNDSAHLAFYQRVAGTV